MLISLTPNYLIFPRPQNFYEVLNPVTILYDNFTIFLLSEIGLLTLNLFIVTEQTIAVMKSQS